MTLSFSKLNEIAYLYENAVHGEQEVLDETRTPEQIRAGQAQAAQMRSTIGKFFTGGGASSSPSKGGSSDPYGASGSSKSSPAPSKYKSSSDGKMYANYNDALAARNSRQKSADYKSPFARERNAKPGLSDIRGGGGNIPARAGSGAPDKPAAGASANPKVVPTKPASAKPAIPTGTTAGGTTFQRRAATGDELRDAQDARAAAKASGNTKGAEEAAVRAGVNASKPATPGVGQKAAAMPSMGSSQFKPATSTQATNAAGSSSAAASGSVVPQNDRLAASKKPVDIKASYEYDAYDLVLEYLLSQGHAETVAEAQYLMTEMDAEMIGDIVEEVLEEGDNYDKNRKRAAQRAAARNEARAKGQTGNVPGVGYVTSRRESETYRDSAGTERHKTGARMPEKKG
jgi:hypothetical protein